MHGERKIEKEEKEENYRRVERQYGTFTRTFTLPQTVDNENVSATYDKGVLNVACPRKPKRSRSRSKSTSAEQGSEKTDRRRKAA